VIPASFNQNNSFVKGWHIDNNVCDEVVNFYNNNEHRQTKGKTYGNAVKISKDITILPNESLSVELQNYLSELNSALDEYKKTFPFINEIGAWKISEGINIQKYEPNEAFFSLHCEVADIKRCSRMLVFMTYLNTVDNGGGTEFPFESLILKAEKGLTVFFPAGWTHPHRGIVSSNQQKYIITGWYNFVEAES